MASASASPTPSTVEEIFAEYSGRRAGLIRALTDDVDKFYEFCDPEKENLCLYGYPNEHWEATLPCEHVPSALPEPTLGINFARDSMSRIDWLFLVAVHSDCWLISVAFYHGAGAGLNADERMRLFNLINSLPDVYEVVRDWRPTKDKHRKDGSSEASGSKSRSTLKRSSDGYSKSAENIVAESYEQNEEVYGVTLCGHCRGRYSGDQFWIACDVCQLWYHGMCVGVTPTMAETIDQYKCPFCNMKRTNPS